MIADHRHHLVVDIEPEGFVTVGRLLYDSRPGWSHLGRSSMTLGDAVFASLDDLASAYWSALDVVHAVEAALS